MSFSFSTKKLFAIIADEDTCTGFLLGGIGHINNKTESNFFIVHKETNVKEIEDKFQKFINRQDVGILLINQYIAEMIRPVINSLDMRHTIPIIEVPSKDADYDPNSDPLLKRAKKFCGGIYK